MDELDPDRLAGGYTVRDRRWWAREEEEAAPAPQKPTAIAALEAELADRDRRLREAVARQQQALLEVDQARTRLEADARREIERARRELIAAFLPVLDDLDRALAAASARGASDPLVAGVELVRSGFLARLRGVGVEPIDPTGEPFDPARHEAISVVPVARERDGSVISTAQAGYSIAGELLRPARVVVGKAASQS
jgi:molecular chaperone GrpE